MHITVAVLMNDGDLKVFEFQVIGRESSNKLVNLDNNIVTDKHPIERARDMLSCQNIAKDDYVMFSAKVQHERNVYVGYPEYHERDVTRISTITITGKVDERTSMRGEYTPPKDDQMADASFTASNVYLTDDIVDVIYGVGPTVNQVKINLCGFFNLKLMYDMPIDITLSKEIVKESYQYI